MLLRLVAALILGGLMGIERERIGKEAGVGTAMLVAAGASIFSMISLAIPHIADGGQTWGTIPDRVAANIVVGIGFLGAGIIIQRGGHVRGLTTAALIWAVAAVGTLVGLGLIPFAAASAVIISGTLYLIRRIGIKERVRDWGGENESD